jgi:hypothetical protein
LHALVRIGLKLRRYLGRVADRRERPSNVAPCSIAGCNVAFDPHWVQTSWRQDRAVDLPEHAHLVGGDGPHDGLLPTTSSTQCRSASIVPFTH